MLFTSHTAQPFQALLTSGRRLLLHELRRFGTVGLFGFMVDTVVVYGLRESFGMYGAGLASYFAASTTTWVTNRAWTFAGRGSGNAFRQWLQFLSANVLGAVLNRGTFFLLVWLIPLCASYPVLAIAAGVAAGLFANFSMARKIVFRAQPGVQP